MTVGEIAYVDRWTIWEDRDGEPWINALALIYHDSRGSLPETGRIRIQRTPTGVRIRRKDLGRGARFERHEFTYQERLVVEVR